LYESPLAFDKNVKLRISGSSAAPARRQQRYAAINYVYVRSNADLTQPVLLHGIMEICKTVKEKKRKTKTGVLRTNGTGMNAWTQS